MKKKAINFFVLLLACTQAAYGMGKKETTEDLQKVEKNLNDAHENFSNKIIRDFVDFAEKYVDTEYPKNLHDCVCEKNVVLKNKLAEEILSFSPPKSFDEVYSYLEKGNLVLKAFDEFRLSLLKQPSPENIARLEKIWNDRDIHQVKMNILFRQMGSLEGALWCSIL